jgi:hypothetical protein
MRRRRHAPARDHGLDILAGRRPGSRPAAGPATMDPGDLLATPPVADDLGAQLAARPPRARLPTITLALAAAVLIGAGFLGGLSVGKSSASTGSGLPAGLAGGGLPGFPTGSGLPSGAGGSGGAAQGAGGSGLPGGFGGGTVGTIKLVDGHTIYVQSFSGSITRVSTSGSTRIQVSAAGTLKDLRPGETVAVQGSKRSDGSVAAASVSQSSLGGGGG